MCEVATKRGKSVPNTEVRLTFMLSGNPLKGYTSTIQVVGLDKGFTRDPLE